MEYGCLRGKTGYLFFALSFLTTETSYIQVDYKCLTELPWPHITVYKPECPVMSTAQLWWCSSQHCKYAEMGDCGGGSVSQVLVMQICRPELSPQNPHKNAWHRAVHCSPRAGEVDTGGSLRLVGQPAVLIVIWTRSGITWWVGH